MKDKIIMEMNPFVAFLEGEIDDKEKREKIYWIEVYLADIRHKLGELERKFKELKEIINI